MNIKGLFKRPEKFTSYDPDSPAERDCRTEPESTAPLGGNDGSVHRTDRGTGL